MTDINTPPQSDTVVEVSKEMRDLVDSLIDNVHHAAWNCQGRDEPDIVAVQEKLLREIARLEKKAQGYDNLLTTSASWRV